MMSAMTKKMEVLAPAGNMECLKAALMAGADAIYCAGTLFGARAYAGNFDDQAMLLAVDLVHQYGKKIYVTMNTIIYEKDISNCMKQVDYYYHIGVDALIIQDIGLLSLVHANYPDFELHCSTQMNIHDVKGVQFAKNLGASRVVLARECAQSMVQVCCQQGIEIEVFVYGALCSSYSGQCYIACNDSFRSGNKGTCSQNCRLPYNLTIDGKETDISMNPYVLSLKDLNLIEHVNDLYNDGVTSLKIEGRMKNSGYVYYVTSLFVKARDLAYENKAYRLSKNEEKLLKLLFNRGFTLGYYFDHTDSKRAMIRPNHMGIPVAKVLAKTKNGLKVKVLDTLNQHDGLRLLNKVKDQGIYVSTMKDNFQFITTASKGDVVELVTAATGDIGDILVKTSDQSLLDQLQDEINSKVNQIPLDIDIDILNKKTITIIALDGYNRQFSKTYSVTLEKSDKASILENSFKKSFSKIKETAFYLNQLTVSEDYYFLPINQINDIRRDFINDYLNQLIIRKNKRITQFTFPTFTHTFQKPQPLIWCENLSNPKNEIGFIISTKSEDVSSRVQSLIHLNLNKTEGLAIQYIGDIDGSFHIGLPFIPVTNSYSLQVLLQNNVIPTLSYECDLLDAQQIMDAYIKRNQQKPVCYQFKKGTMRLMEMKDCLIKNLFNQPLHCQMCHQHKIILSDRSGHQYKLEGDDQCILGLYTLQEQTNEILADATALVQLF